MCYTNVVHRDYSQPRGTPVYQRLARPQSPDMRAAAATPAKERCGLQLVHGCTVTNLEQLDLGIDNTQQLLATF